jgi:outer membrane cobalamin receptor
MRFSYGINWTDKMYSLNNSGRPQELPAKTLHNAGVSWSSLSKRYKVGLSVSNIFDLDYQEEYGYPAAGRNFSLNMEWVVF